MAHHEELAVIRALLPLISLDRRLKWFPYDPHITLPLNSSIPCEDIPSLMQWILENQLCGDVEGNIRLWLSEYERITHHLDISVHRKMVYEEYARFFMAIFQTIWQFSKPSDVFRSLWNTMVQLDNTAKHPLIDLEDGQPVRLCDGPNKMIRHLHINPRYAKGMMVRGKGYLVNLSVEKWILLLTGCYLIHTNLRISDVDDLCMLIAAFVVGGGYGDGAVESQWKTINSDTTSVSDITFLKHSDYAKSHFKLIQRCDYCGQWLPFSRAKRHRCGGGGVDNRGYCPSRYCNRQCQRSDWPKHRRFCGPSSCCV